MKSQSIYRSKRTIPIALMLIFVMVGCTGQLPLPTQPPAASATVESSPPTQDPAASPTEPGVEPTASSQPTTDENVLYRDDFTNLASGWPSADFGDYYIGYHEPEYYHVEIKTPNAKAPVKTAIDLPHGFDGKIARHRLMTNSRKRISSPNDPAILANNATPIPGGCKLAGSVSGNNRWIAITAIISNPPQHDPSAKASSGRSC